MRTFSTLLMNTAFLICFVLALAAAGSAATLTVTKIIDTRDGLCDKDCSLREAIDAASSGDTIVFVSPLFDTAQVITLSEAVGLQDLIIGENLTIAGRGANLLTVRRSPSAVAKFRIFTIPSGFTVNLSGMTITGGDAASEAGGIYNLGSVTTIIECLISNNTSADSGAIRNEGAGAVLNLVNSTITNNTAGSAFSGAAGIFNLAPLNITNSTISGNTKTLGANNAGGIITNSATTIIDSTIADNEAGGTPNLSAGGLMIVNGAAVSVRNTIVAGNRNTAAFTDANAFSASFTTAGYNLIGSVPAGMGFTNGFSNDIVGTPAAPINPQLDPLANYGGPTPTHRLQAGAPPVDRGNAFNAGTDQRGSARGVDNPAISNLPTGDRSDIGAYELQFSSTVTKTADTNDGVCDSDCSLREAIATSLPGYTIGFASPLFDSPQVITLSDAAGFRSLLIGKNLTIAGKGANLLTIRRDPAASAIFRVFIMNVQNTHVTLSGMTITGGADFSTVDVGGGGGGARVQAGTLNVSSCHITGNSAGFGGGGLLAAGTGRLNVTDSTVSNNTILATGGTGAGIYFGGSISSIVNSTVSGNVSNGTGVSVGGIFSANFLTITNSTITDNQGGGTGAGGFFGRATITNTIIAGNRNNSTLPDVGANTPLPGDPQFIVSGGYNVIGNVGMVGEFIGPNDQKGTGAAPLDPVLAPLAFNGGVTLTHAVLPGSPALDKGNSFGLATDQRGNGRPLDNPASPPAPGGDNSDVGAFEASRFAPLVVNRTEDTNDGVCDIHCSLREAIAAAAPSGNEIVFAPLLFNVPQTITLSDAPGFRDLSITKSLTITGTGADMLTVRRDFAALSDFRVFEVNGLAHAGQVGGMSVDISGMTITGGFAKGTMDAGGGGGGIRNIGNVLTISECHLIQNTAITAGAAIRNMVNSRLNLINSTVDHNSLFAGDGAGAGIHSDGPFLTIANSTISGNTSGNSFAVTASGGGLWAGGGFITSSTITDNGVNGTGAGGVFANGLTTIRNSIVAGNRNNFNVADTAGTFNSSGYNLIGNVGSASGFTAPNDQKGTSINIIDPLLNTINNYGGKTPTHSLRPGSPALDMGNSFTVPKDQRGMARPIDQPSIWNAGDGADIGAFEVQVPTAASVTISGRVLTADGRGLKNAYVILTDMSGNSQTAVTGPFGYYTFPDVAVGETYVIGISSKQHNYESQIITVLDDMNELNFIAAPQTRGIRGLQ